MGQFIQYRTFTTEDITEVLQMWQGTSGVRMHDNGEDSESGIRQCILRNEGLSFVAEDHGTMIGAVLNGEDGRRGYIYHLVVKENYRKQGIASQLLALTEQKMSSLNIHKLALFVLDENEGAQKFYETIGWKEVNEAKTYAKLV